MGKFIPTILTVRPASNWWDLPGVSPSAIWAIYTPKGAASLADSYVNRARPGTNDATVGVAPTWNSSDGWIFNGSTQYLDSGFVPSNDQAQSMFIQYTGRSNTNVLASSFESTSKRLELRTDSSILYANGGGATQSPNLDAGNLGVAGDDGYRNGVSESLTLGAWGGSTVTTVAIGCRNQSGSPNTFWQGNVQAVVFYSVTLTPAQITTLVARMAAL